MPGAIIKRINTENAIYLFNVMHVSIINVILVNPNNEYKIPLILLLFNSEFIISKNLFFLSNPKS